jgi:hypothetical protein
MAIERLLTGSIRDQVRELVSTEDLVLESIRDLVKDELKAYIRERIDQNEELKAELKEAVTYYFNAKARSLYAELKATRAAARLGVQLLPDDLQEEFSAALVTLFEDDLVNLLDRAL